MKLIPFNLQNLIINFSKNNSKGNTINNMKYLREVLQKLPNYLQNLHINLYSKDLGRNKENMLLLRDGLKYLPNNL